MLNYLATYAVDAFTFKRYKRLKSEGKLAHEGTFRHVEQDEMRRAPRLKVHGETPRKLEAKSIMSFSPKFAQATDKTAEETGKSGTIRKVLAAACVALMVAACGPSDSSFPTTTGQRGPTNPNPDPNAERESIFGEDGLVLFGGSGGDGANGGGGIGVNSFLWRASLDTVSFVPLASADPFGGVIITEWYSDPTAPTERFKLTVYILDKRLRADGLKVAVFRQERAGDEWRDAGANAATSVQLENAILMRARELRVNTLEADEG